jgi:hypothetical protein
MTRKFIGVFVVAAAVMVLSVTPAQAAGAQFAPNGGPWCVLLDNFCDQLSISTDASANNYGWWEWTCGSEWTNVLGQNAAPATTGTRPVASGVPFAFTANFVWSVGPMLFDLWGTDGFGTFMFQNDQGFSFTPGKCAGAPSDNRPAALGEYINR